MASNAQVLVEAHVIEKWWEISSVSQAASALIPPLWGAVNVWEATGWQERANGLLSSETGYCSTIWLLSDPIGWQGRSVGPQYHTDWLINGLPVVQSNHTLSCWWLFISLSCVHTNAYWSVTSGPLTLKLTDPEPVYSNKNSPGQVAVKWIYEWEKKGP